MRKEDFEKELAMTICETIQRNQNVLEAIVGYYGLQETDSPAQSASIGEECTEEHGNKYTQKDCQDSQEVPSPAILAETPVVAADTQAWRVGSFELCEIYSSWFAAG